MKSIYLLLLISFSTVSFSQTKIDYNKVDKKISEIPTQSTVSVNAIADFISSNFKSDEEKIRAVFYWTASNIDYDVNKKFMPYSKITPEERINTTLKTRKGVCSNYTEVFHAVANSLGIKTVIITGVVKQNGVVKSIPHAWCASIIEGVWYIFDPTWGSGYVDKGNYFRKIDNNYFKANPKEIILSHLPYDYIWQFLNYPITYEDFYSGKYEKDTSKQYFDFENEILRYNSLTELEKLISSNERIKSNGVKNSAILDRLDYNKQQIENIKRKEVFTEFNSLLKLYKEGVTGLNEFIRYRNRKFKPSNSDKELKKMISEPYGKLIYCQELLDNLGPENEKYISNLKALKESIKTALVMAKEHNDFVFYYLSKSKNDRDLLIQGSES